MSHVLSNTLTFSDEQSMLLDTAVEFCRKHSPIAGVRDLLLDETGFAADVWQEMVQLGWLGLAVPEQYGGSGLGLAAAVPIVEPMGRNLLGTPFVSTQMAVQALLAGGSDEHRSTWLPQIAEGRAASVALVEEDGNWDLAAVACAATETSGGVALTGTKTLVLDVPNVDLLLVSVVLGDAPAVALVPTAALVHPPQREVVLDETRRSYRIALDGITLPRTALISGDAARAALTAIEQTAWLLYSADACGGINGVIDALVEYLTTRTQFGRKIGSYQALKHPTVDILMSLERARSHVYHAASLIDAGEPAEIALRMAKAHSAEAYSFAGDRAIQFHGGFGFTYECDAQLFLRRALWLQCQYGDAPHHRHQLATALLDS